MAIEIMSHIVKKNIQNKHSDGQQKKDRDKAKKAKQDLLNRLKKNGGEKNEGDEAKESV
jgi:hypothetical protein